MRKVFCFSNNGDMELIHYNYRTVLKCKAPFRRPLLTVNIDAVNQWSCKVLSAHYKIRTDYSQSKVCAASTIMLHLDELLLFAIWYNS